MVARRWQLHNLLSRKNYCFSGTIDPEGSKQVGTPDTSFSEGLALGTDGVPYVPVNETPGHPGEPTIVALNAV